MVAGPARVFGEAGLEGSVDGGQALADWQVLDAGLEPALGCVHFLLQLQEDGICFVEMVLDGRVVGFVMRFSPSFGEVGSFGIGLCGQMGLLALFMNGHQRHSIGEFVIDDDFFLPLG